MDWKKNPYFWVVKYIYMQTVKQKVWSEASFFSHSHALSECEACRICVWNSDAMPVLQIVKKKIDLRKRPIFLESIL